MDEIPSHTKRSYTLLETEAQRVQHKEENEPVPVTKRTKKEFKTRNLECRHGFAEMIRINDTIHQSIFLCPVMKAITDTQPFQRLESLRQLGLATTVYPTATHTRKDHSLGVSYLSDKMCKHLKELQPQLMISDKDILCVRLAGLCHDLGHGPFSHVYDGPFRAAMKRQQSSSRAVDSSLYREVEHLSVPDDWSHEDASLLMLDDALRELGLAIDTENLDKPLKQIGVGNEVNAEAMCVFSPSGTGEVLTSRDFIFIKECIMGYPIDGGCAFVGRDANKEFLYDVVSNRHSGLDMDKLDYISRDNFGTMGTVHPQDDIFIHEAFVAWGKCSRPHKCFKCTPNNVGRHLMICYPEKVVPKAIDFFRMRFYLFKNVYTHKTVVSREADLLEVLTLADPYFRIHIDTDGHDLREHSSLPISKAMLDASAYRGINDSIMHTIRVMAKDAMARGDPWPVHNKLMDALDRFNGRKLMALAGSQVLGDSALIKSAWGDKDGEHFVDEDRIIDDILALSRKHGEKLNRKDMQVQKLHIHWGMKKDNPVKLMRFLHKKDLGLLQNDVDALPEAREILMHKYKCELPQAFEELSIRVFSWKSKAELVERLFDEWFESCVFNADRATDGPKNQGFETSQPVCSKFQQGATSPRTSLGFTLEHSASESEGNTRSTYNPAQTSIPDRKSHLGSTDEENRLRKVRSPDIHVLTQESDEECDNSIDNYVVA